MAWQVNISKRAKKGIAKLPKQARAALVLLLADIEDKGPVRGDWPNYGKLGKSRHHCHLKKGNPTYVAMWEVVTGEIKLVEVIYAGSHEKAPY